MIKIEKKCFCEKCFGNINTLARIVATALIILALWLDTFWHKQGSLGVPKWRNQEGCDQVNSVASNCDPSSNQTFGIIQDTSSCWVRFVRLKYLLEIISEYHNIWSIISSILVISYILIGQNVTIGFLNHFIAFQS